LTTTARCMVVERARRDVASGSEFYGCVTSATTNIATTQPTPHHR
jgi:hypothetical protein